MSLGLCKHHEYKQQLNTVFSDLAGSVELRSFKKAGMFQAVLEKVLGFISNIGGLVFDL